MKSFRAIAAMSLNRVIGRGNQIPWHLPEDFKWFKQTTMGQVLVMGRKTFESIGRPLPGRETVVLSRGGFTAAGVRVVAALADLPPVDDLREWFVCGGAEIYRQALPRCADLLLTLVKREVPDGDAFFPPFEEQFELAATLRDTPEFSILHYRRKAGPAARTGPPQIHPIG
jgi:dihydrofolate reductase